MEARGWNGPEEGHECTPDRGSSLCGLTVISMRGNELRILQDTAQAMPTMPERAQPRVITPDASRHAPPSQLGRSLDDVGIRIRL